MFRARHLKRSHHFRKGVERFVNYKRHLLAEADVEAIRGKLAGLRQLEAARSPQDVLQPKQDELEKMCRDALPGGIPRVGFVEENVEVFFTAIVIALGIRAFLLQPFKIPTGSMQPTLNGVRAEVIAETESFPGAPARVWQRVWNRRHYFERKAPSDGRLGKPQERNFLMFFTWTEYPFSGGSVIKIPAPLDVARRALGMAQWEGREVKAGQVLARGWVEGGDQLLVDKVSYHFRRPSRGEVFVFTTKGIKGIESGSAAWRPEFGSQHYIKRLVAVPGDTLEITQSHELLVNGARATAFGCERVMSMKNGYNGYIPPPPRGPGDATFATFKLEPGAYPRFWSEGRVPQPVYWAMGDNQLSSLDSRYWGPVPQANLVGPALFVYWPFGNHLGFIR